MCKKFWKWLSGSEDKSVKVTRTVMEEDAPHAQAGNMDKPENKLKGAFPVEKKLSSKRKNIHEGSEQEGAG